jgi:hypothetical protein
VFGINYRLYRYDAFFDFEENALLPFHSSESLRQSAQGESISFQWLKGILITIFREEVSSRYLLMILPTLHGLPHPTSSGH